MNYTETEANLIIEAAEALQKEMISFIDKAIEKNPKLSYDAAKDTFFILRIAELQVEILELVAKTENITVDIK